MEPACGPGRVPPVTSSTRLGGGHRGLCGTGWHVLAPWGHVSAGTHRAHPPTGYESVNVPQQSLDAAVGTHTVSLPQESRPPCFWLPFLFLKLSSRGSLGGPLLRLCATNAGNMGSLVGELRSHKQATGRNEKKQLSSHSEVFSCRILAWWGRQVRALRKMSPGKRKVSPHCREQQDGQGREAHLLPPGALPRPLLVLILQGSRFQSCWAGAAGSLQRPPSWVGSPPRAGCKPQRSGARGPCLFSARKVQCRPLAQVSGPLCSWGSHRQAQDSIHPGCPDGLPEPGPRGWEGRECPRLLGTVPPTSWG